MNLFKSNEEHIFTGSEIEVQALRSLLFDEQITSIVKNRSNSAILAGYGDSGLIQLYVNKDNLEAALSVVENFKNSQNHLDKI